MNTQLRVQQNNSALTTNLGINHEEFFLLGKFQGVRFSGIVDSKELDKKFEKINWICKYFKNFRNAEISIAGQLIYTISEGSTKITIDINPDIGEFDLEILNKELEELGIIPVYVGMKWDSKFPGYFTHYQNCINELNKHSLKTALLVSMERFLLANTDRKNLVENILESGNEKYIVGSIKTLEETEFTALIETFKAYKGSTSRNYDILLTKAQGVIEEKGLTFKQRIGIILSGFIKPKAIENNTQVVIPEEKPESKPNNAITLNMTNEKNRELCEKQIIELILNKVESELRGKANNSQLSIKIINGGDEYEILLKELGINENSSVYGKLEYKISDLVINLWIKHIQLSNAPGDTKNQILVENLEKLKSIINGIITILKKLKSSKEILSEISTKILLENKEEIYNYVSTLELGSKERNNWGEAIKKLAGNPESKNKFYPLFLEELICRIEKVEVLIRIMKARKFSLIEVEKYLGTTIKNNINVLVNKYMSTSSIQEKESIEINLRELTNENKSKEVEEFRPCTLLKYKFINFPQSSILNEIIKVEKNLGDLSIESIIHIRKTISYIPNSALFIEIGAQLMDIEEGQISKYLDNIQKNSSESVVRIQIEEAKQIGKHISIEELNNVKTLYETEKRLKKQIEEIKPINKNLQSIINWYEKSKIEIKELIELSTSTKILIKEYSRLQEEIFESLSNTKEYNTEINKLLPKSYNITEWLDEIIKKIESRKLELGFGFMKELDIFVLDESLHEIKIKVDSEYATDGNKTIQIHNTIREKSMQLRLMKLGIRYIEISNHNDYNGNKLNLDGSEKSTYHEKMGYSQFITIVESVINKQKGLKVPIDISYYYAGKDLGIHLFNTLIKPDIQEKLFKLGISGINIANVSNISKTEKGIRLKLPSDIDEIECDIRDRKTLTIIGRDYEKEEIIKLILKYINGYCNLKPEDMKKKINEYFKRK